MSPKQIVKDFCIEAGIGVTGYVTAIQFNFIEEAAHWIGAIITAISCYVAVHYFKKAVKWFDETVLKIKPDKEDDRKA
jgi:putative Mn2+ efflux pump MntP